MEDYRIKPRPSMRGPPRSRQTPLKMVRVYAMIASPHHHAYKYRRGSVQRHLSNEIMKVTPIVSINAIREASDQELISDQPWP